MIQTVSTYVGHYLLLFERKLSLLCVIYGELFHMMYELLFQFTDLLRNEFNLILINTKLPCVFSDFIV